MLTSLRLAFGFLTVLPIPSAPFRVDDARRATAAFPVVGAVLGGILALAFHGLSGAEPGLRSGVLTVLWLVLTGALHFDGVCDVADAALAPLPMEERRRILKDPRKGAFAVAAGASLLLLKSAALQTPMVPWLFVFMLAWARTVVLVPMTWFAPYPESIMGKAARPALAEVIRAVAAVVLLAIGLGAGGVLSWGALALVAGAGACAALVVAGALTSRLGGVGGDVFGAVIEVSEVAMLVGWALYA